MAKTQYWVDDTLALEGIFDEDVSGADELKMLWENNGGFGEYEVEMVDGFNNKVETEYQPLDVAGVWKFQAYAKMGEREVRGHPQTIVVERSLRKPTT